MNIIREAKYWWLLIKRAVFNIPDPEHLINDYVGDEYKIAIFKNMVFKREVGEYAKQRWLLQENLQ